MAKTISYWFCFREHHDNHLKISGTENASDISDGISVISDEDSGSDEIGHHFEADQQKSLLNTNRQNQNTVTEYDNVLMRPQSLDKDEGMLLCHHNLKWISSNILMLSFIIGFATIAMANYLRLNAVDQSTSNEHNTLLAQRVQKLELENEALKIIIKRLSQKQDNYDNEQAPLFPSPKIPPTNEKPLSNDNTFNKKKYSKQVWTGDSDEPIFIAPKDDKYNDKYQSDRNNDDKAKYYTQKTPSNEHYEKKKKAKIERFHEKRPNEGNMRDTSKNVYDENSTEKHTKKYIKEYKKDIDANMDWYQKRSKYQEKEQKKRTNKKERHNNYPKDIYL